MMWGAHNFVTHCTYNTVEHKDRTNLQRDSIILTFCRRSSMQRALPGHIVASMHLAITTFRESCTIFSSCFACPWMNAVRTSRYVVDDCHCRTPSRLKNVKSQAIYSAIFTVMTEHNLIAGMYLVETKSLKELEGALQKIHQRYQQPSSASTVQRQSEVIFTILKAEEQSDLSSLPS